MTADLIILNGALMSFDAAQPSATALAISSARISAVGTDAEIRALADPATTIIDAHGGTVLPGFIDSHIHLFGGAVEMDLLNLAGIADTRTATRAIRQRAEQDQQSPSSWPSAPNTICSETQHLTATRSIRSCPTARWR